MRDKEHLHATWRYQATQPLYQIMDIPATWSAVEAPVQMAGLARRFIFTYLGGRDD